MGPFEAQASSPDEIKVERKEGDVVHRDLSEAQASLSPQPSKATPPMGMKPGWDGQVRGLYPLPRFCEPSPPHKGGTREPGGGGMGEGSGRPTEPWVGWSQYMGVVYRRR